MFKPTLSKKLLIILFLLFSTACSSSAREIEVYFTPSYRALDAIVDEINASKRSVIVAVYNFTSRPLARALASAKRRGVDVRVVLDRSANDPTQNRYTKYVFLKQNGIDVRFAKPHRRWDRNGIMHNKFAVIDSKVVITGSANWTASAFAINDENVLIIRRPDIANAYTKEFERLWKHSSKR